MAYRALLSLPAVLGSSSLCTAAWLQRAVVPAASWAADGAWRSVATARSDDATLAPRTEGLPPPWEPPPHNPKSLKPKPAPTLPEILARIQQAPTAVEVHNAYRRKSGCLPPPVAAAMFTRLAQLLAVPPSQQQQQQRREHAPASAEGGSAAACAPQPRERGQGALLAEIRRSWHVFLHLTPAKHLASLVRASCETGLLLQPAAATAATAGATGGPASSAASTTADQGLVQRSLEVLLDAGGRELAEAGPQAVLDLSYGLMLANHDDAATWRTLGPLLREAELQLKPADDDGAAGSPVAPDKLAGEVLQWLQHKGLAA
ncbi:hypothetical protein PLESTB_000068900 [Pleodorina starrii]|uniref:Uncharacterized protein n=1 Tax=Pleodorina starrii TaxID=330485 RepID=A0A9W6B9P9_9CHLO|nr:hypothetical protein PLESTM_001604400 [Pleodorina starrii]GLC48189.1 hypothetical protein PLESTB_000068900 [Pleodorina starrii]GLC67434.1 hypothetical protein PLESTF_000555800 [Pleodorina starrii]